MSVVWTLEPDGSPESAATLEARGIADPGIVWPNQAPGVLTMTLKLAGGVVADLSTYAFDSVWVLRRDGSVFFRGRVRSAPRRSGNDTAGLTLVDAWGDLDDTPYLQIWDVVGSDGSIDQQQVPRALISPPASRQTSAEALAAVIAAAAEAGTTVGLSITGLPSLLLPPIEAANLSCGELIRTILRYHPGATARISYGTATDTLQIRDRSTAPATTYEVGERPLADFNLTRRDDQVVDSVHVMYETSAARFNEVAGEAEGDPATIRATRRLAVFKDVWPIGAAITRKSLAVVLSVPPIAEPPAPPIPQRVAIKTRPLPPTGANDTEAQKWWLDMLGLASLGLTVDVVLLPPPGSVGQEHRVRFAWEADDPDDPLHEMPSPVNPASTPVWRPDSVEDLPRQLIAGNLAEWMRVDAADVVVDADLAIKKSAVDALGIAAWKKVMSYAPVEREVGGFDCYVINHELRVRATNAKTRVYTNSTVVGSYNPAADTLASLEAAREEAVVPDLAQTLYLERIDAPWEGTIPLLEQEAGAVRHLGSAINLNHPDRPEWATMKALVQEESLNLEKGETLLSVGPPAHLSHQDRAALWQAARAARAKRAEAYQASPSPREDESDADLNAVGIGGVFHGAVGPVKEPQHPGAAKADPTPWDLIVIDAEAGTVKVGPGTIIRDDSNLTVALTIANADDTFTIAAGQTIRIKMTGPFDTPVATMESGGPWTDHPAAIETTGSGDTAAFASYFYPLWEFVGEAGSGTIPIKAGLYARRLAPQSNFLRTASTYHKAGDKPFARPLLLPYHGKLSS